MSARRFVDVFCDGDDCLVWAVDATATTAAEARRNARAYGWTCDRSGDYCPSCTTARQTT